MIEAEALTKLYDKFVAVDHLSLTVRPGEVLGLVGQNGAGKTTTLRCLAGIIPPTSGLVRLGGHSLEKDPIAAKRELAFFSDEPRLFDYLTVEQHLAFVARIYQVADYRERARPLLEELEMADKTGVLPAELSRGMKQKLAIACGLIHSPERHPFRRTAHRPGPHRHPAHEGDDPAPGARGGRRSSSAATCCRCWRRCVRTS